MGKKDKPAKPLTGLAAALVKAGKLDEKKARNLTREARREEKALGREGVEERDAQKRAELEARKEAEAEASRQRERQRLEGETMQRARRTVHDHADPGYRGNRRWFFVTRAKRILFLDVNDSTAGLLREGQAGIVESLGQATEDHTVVLTERALVTLVGIDKELVRFWNRPSGASPASSGTRGDRS